MKYGFLVLLIVSNCSIAWGHFSFAPKIEIAPSKFEEPDKILFRIKSFKATRNQFNNYLQRITAFDTRYDRVQPNYFSHFALVRDIALMYPENVHKYIDQLNITQKLTPSDATSVKNWFVDQASMYARIRHYQQIARSNKLDKSAQTLAVTNFYAAAAKTEFVEELIVLGNMPTTVEGLKNFIANVNPDERPFIDTGRDQDTEVSSPQEQQQLKRRWAEFRRDVLSSINVDSTCRLYSKPDTSSETILFKIGHQSISVAYYNAIYGKPHSLKYLERTRNLNCKRMALFYTIAQLADELNIIPERIKTKIKISSGLYTAALGIMYAVQPQIDTVANFKKGELIATKTLVRFPNILKARDTVVKQTQSLFNPENNKYLDREFLARTPWELKRVMAAKHSIHI